MKRRFTAFATAGITLLTAGLSAFTAVPDEISASTTDDIRIMAIGDSITDGYGITGSYRKYLDYALTQKGYSTDFVGIKDEYDVTFTYNGESYTYDNANVGYSGYAIQAYNGRSGIYETLFNGWNVISDKDPDIILLQIGTNDLLDARLEPLSNAGDITATTSALERLESLVMEIIANMDDTDMLFLASVPYIDAEVRYDWLGNYGWNLGYDTSGPNAELTAYVQECVDTYNAGVETLAESLAAQDYNVGFSDINSKVDMKTQLADGVHPNESGYESMGLHWAEVIGTYLEGGNITTQPTTTSTTTSTSTSTTTTTTTSTETTTTTTTSTETTTTTTTTTTTSTETTTTTTTTTTTSTTTTTTTTSEKIALAPIIERPLDKVVAGEEFDVNIVAYMNDETTVIPVEKLMLSLVCEGGFEIVSVSETSPALGGADVTYDENTGIITITCDEATRAKKQEILVTVTLKTPADIQPGDYKIFLDEELFTLITTGGAESDQYNLLLGTQTITVVDESEYRIADLVKLTDYLLGRDNSGITAENAEKYDMNSDKTLDVWDLIDLKVYLTETKRVTSSNSGSNTVFVPNDNEVVIIDDSATLS